MAKVTLSIEVNRLDNIVRADGGYATLNAVSDYLRSNWSARLQTMSVPVGENSGPVIYLIEFDDPKRATEFVLKYG